MHQQNWHTTAKHHSVPQWKVSSGWRKQLQQITLKQPENILFDVSASRRNEGFQREAEMSNIVSRVV